MFIPGETITHHFVIPFSVFELNENHAKIYITYKTKTSNDEHVILERSVTSGWTSEMAGYSRIEITITQKESLLFKDLDDCFIQLNVKLNDSRLSSQLIKCSTGIQLKREVIS